MTEHDRSSPFGVSELNFKKKYSRSCHGPVLDLLELPKLRINRESEETSSGTKMHDDFIKVQYEDLEPWTDFNKANIYAMFGDLLDQNVLWNWGSFLGTGKDACTERTFNIKSEADVNDMFRNTLTKIVQHTWDTTAPILQERLNPGTSKSIIMNFEGTTIRVPAKAGNEKIHSAPNKDEKESLKRKASDDIVGAHLKKKFKSAKTWNKKPDWPVYYVDLEGDKGSSSEGAMTSTQLIKIPYNKEVDFSVIGECKRLHVFNPKNFEDKESYKRHAMVTVAQLAMYAYHGKTRYGFAINSKNVTFFRFYLIPDETNPMRLGAQHCTFPLEYTNGEMSACTALWAFGQLGMNDRHRQIVSKSETLSLDNWHELTHDGQTYYMHHISERVVSVAPNSVTAMESTGEHDDKLRRWISQKSTHGVADSVVGAIPPRSKPFRDFLRPSKERKASKKYGLTPTQRKLQSSLLLSKPKPKLSSKSLVGNSGQRGKREQKGRRQL
ncbi:hypothetical protein F4775DRAFT_604127 [Biscogniauxia sp. FL1348]|nr:hypothetical protein F4775DRAFT_604127 [Biscogniauxia sp. FL1348]